MDNSFLDTVLYTFGEVQLTLGILFLWVLGMGFLLIGYRILKRRVIPNFIGKRTYITAEEKSELIKLVRTTAIITGLLITLIASGFDLDLTPKSSVNFKISYLLVTVIIFYVAWISNWFTTNIFIHDAFSENEKTTSTLDQINTSSSSNTEDRISRIGRLALLVLAANLVVQLFNINYTLFSRQLDDGLTFDFKISNILILILIIIGTQLIIWLITNVILKNIVVRNNLDKGASFAIGQLVKYVIWTLAIFFGLDALGIDVTLLLGGAAALLVGIGLGLQQTFNDFISGVVLLFERSVKVGDMLETHGLIGTVKKIGLRSSIVESRALESIIVPNSQLVNSEVINWSYDSDKCRFEIDLSVAYGTDTKVLKTLLLKMVKDNPYVMEFPAPFVRFISFGDSSLDFKLFFFSRNFLVIEDIKSDIRFEIDVLFREHEIEIPFPQRVIKVVKE